MPRHWCYLVRRAKVVTHADDALNGSTHSRACLPLLMNETGLLEFRVPRMNLCYTLRPGEVRNGNRYLGGKLFFVNS